MFKITSGRGFQMTFENGWTVSVQFGYGNYCENKMRDIIGKESTVGEYKCNDAEFAAWDKDGNWYDFGSDEVKGWCTTNEVASFIEMISKK